MNVLLTDCSSSPLRSNDLEMNERTMNVYTTLLDEASKPIIEYLLVYVQRKNSFRLSAYMSFTNEQRTISFLSTEPLQHFLPTPNRTSAAIENIPTEKQTTTTTEYAIFCSLTDYSSDSWYIKENGRKQLKRHGMISFFLYFFLFLVLLLLFLDLILFR